MGNVHDIEGNELRTPVAFHPGEFLHEEVKERGIRKAEFAGKLGILPGHLSELFKGKRNITARLAVRIEKALNISAEYWLGLQITYDLIHARELEHVLTRFKLQSLAYFSYRLADGFKNNTGSFL